MKNSTRRVFAHIKNHRATLVAYLSLPLIISALASEGGQWSWEAFLVCSAIQGAGLLWLYRLAAKAPLPDEIAVDYQGVVEELALTEMRTHSLAFSTTVGSTLNMGLAQVQIKRLTTDDERNSLYRSRGVPNHLLPLYCDSENGIICFDGSQEQLGSVVRLTWRDPGSKDPSFQKLSTNAKEFLALLRKSE